MLNTLWWRSVLLPQPVCSTKVCLTVSVWTDQYSFSLYVMAWLHIWKWNMCNINENHFQSVAVQFTWSAVASNQEKGNTRNLSWIKPLTWRKNVPDSHQSSEYRVMSPLSNEPQLFQSFFYLFRFVVLWCVCCSLSKLKIFFFKSQIWLMKIIVAKLW